MINLSSGISSHFMFSSTKIAVPPCLYSERHCIAAFFRPRKETVLTSSLLSQCSVKHNIFTLRSPNTTSNSPILLLRLLIFIWHTFLLLSLDSFDSVAFPKNFGSW